MEITGGIEAAARRIGLRARGGSSLSFAHPGLALRFLDDSGRSAPVPLLGMKPGADWVLSAPDPRLDPTLLANQFAWEMIRSAGHWAPDWRFARVRVGWKSGEDRALRIVSERVDAARLGVRPLAQDGSSGGWLLQVNRRDPVTVDGLPPRFFHTPGRNGKPESIPDARRGGDDLPEGYASVINFESPDGPEITAEQRGRIEREVAELEAGLFSGQVGRGNPAEPARRSEAHPAGSPYLDETAWTDAWWLNELCATPEFARFNLWIFRTDGRAPVACFAAWDFDRAFQGAPEEDAQRLSERFWFAAMREDPEWRSRMDRRWRELRSGAWSDGSIRERISALVEKSGPDAPADEHERKVGEWRAWILRRAAWLDRLTASDSGQTPRRGSS
ncbi:MAG: CotH kinase family protein [Kiritimatiellia bacterium]